METRTCQKCHEDRPLEMFYVDLEARKSSKLGRPWKHHCRICHRAYLEEYRKPRVDYSDTVKMERGCADCGIRSDHPEIYDFDHRPGEIKAKSVATLLTSGSFEAFKAEIDKCDVVCSNCHRIRTRQRGHAAFGKGRWVA